MPLQKTETDRWVKQKQTVVALVLDKNRLDKLSATLHDFEIVNVVTEPKELLLGKG